MHDAIKLQMDVCKVLANVCREVKNAQDVLTPLVVSGELSLGDLCDAGLAQRDMENMLEDLRSACRSRKELIARSLAERLGKRAQSDPNEQFRAEGEMASGVAYIKEHPRMPRVGSEEYKTLLRHFGVPEDLAALRVLKVDFERLMEYLSQMENKEQSLPPGIVGINAIPTAIFRRKSATSRGKDNA